MAYLNSESGRRGYYRYMYGTHGWVPQGQYDFSRGIIRDISQVNLPENALYDATDFLVHMQGALVGRGPTAYAGPAMTGATIAAAVAYAEYPAGSKLIAVGDNGHIYNVTSGTTTDLGGSTVTTVDTPKLRIGGGKNLLVFPVSDGTTSPIKYDGSAAPGSLGGTPPAGKYVAVYKSRLALGGASATPQRVYFSPTPDIESTWDTTNSWVDFDHAITGICALQNALLVFSAGHTERLTGSTPPPNSDFDRQPVGDIGCLDARSIAIYKGNAIFANGRGVFMTNGTEFVDLTAGQHGNDGISTYWRRTAMLGYNPASSVIAGGVYQDFYIVSTSNTIMLVCHIPTRAWTRFTTIRGLMFASQVGSTDELYYADGVSNRVGQLSGCFVSADTVDNTMRVDATGLNILPTFETRAFGGGVNNVAFGDVHVTSVLSKDNTNTPVFTMKYKPVGFSSFISSLTTLGTLAVTTNNTVIQYRNGFIAGADAPAIILTGTQSSKGSCATVIRAIEVSMRGYPSTMEGPTL